jgi:YVTN family beta-propeller protein
MNLRISALVAIVAFALAGVLNSAQSFAQNVYITNEFSDTVSVINTASNTVIATIPIGRFPYGVAAAPDGSKVYVTNPDANTVSVIDTATNTVTATIPTGKGSPFGVAATPDSSKVYVTIPGISTVSVIDTATNTVTATIGVGLAIPFGVAVSPDGSKVYITNSQNSTVSVIDTASNAVTATILVLNAWGVAVTPDGSKVYITNLNQESVSVIDTATNKVTATIPVGSTPVAFGIFIQSGPKFAGTPGKANCHGQSVSALAKQYGGLNNAAARLGFDGVNALQNAILTFCGLSPLAAPKRFCRQRKAGSPTSVACCLARTYP